MMYMRAVARAWREIPERYRMEAVKCKKCGAVWFPKRMICAKCRGKEFETFRLSGEGKLLSWSEVTAPTPEFADMVPYTVGMVELKEGIKVFAQIVEFKKLEFGLPVRAVFRRIKTDGEYGTIHYGYKFRPI